MSCEDARALGGSLTDGIASDGDECKVDVELQGIRVLPLDGAPSRPSSPPGPGKQAAGQARGYPDPTLGRRDYGVWTKSH
jgi:hypothetical protein